MRRGAKDYRIPWGSNAICDICGMKFKRHELRKRWDNMMACSKDFETRQPQDLIKGKPDHQKPPFIRDQVDPIYITMTPSDGSHL